MLGHLSSSLHQIGIFCDSKEKAVLLHYNISVSRSLPKPELVEGHPTPSFGKLNPHPARWELLMFQSINFGWGSKLIVELV
jgi:hypothetical protein